MTRTRWLVALGAFVAGVVALGFALLHPPPSDRLELVWILTAPALVAIAAVPLLRRWVARRRSVAGASLAVAACALAIGAIASAAASNAMFLTDHDFRLFLVLALLSAGIALFVGVRLTQPLAADVRRLGQVATAVADGDRTVRTGIDRRDEVGATAAAVDRMVVRLAQTDAERDRLALARHDLLSSVGHDLRTPLAAMRSAVESLQDGLAPDPDRYLALVGSQIETLAELIDQLFEYARIESGGEAVPTERISIGELADETAEALEPTAARRHVKIDVHVDGPAVVVGSPTRLARVLRNLLDNAVRHTPPDGIVRIEVATSRDDVSVRVRDSGEGFPEEFKARAFEPFTRADRARAVDGSAGLGLAIARAIVDSHGGTISLGDGPGGDVMVRLPVTTGVGT